MSEMRFTFRGEDDEAPIRDDQPRFGAPPQEEASDPAGSALGPLYLARPSASPRRRAARRFPLVLASVITFLLAAGVAAALLGPPAALQTLVGSATGILRPAGQGQTPPAAPSPPELPPMAATAPTVESAAAEAATEVAADDSGPTSSKVPEVTQQPPEAKAAPEAPARKRPPRKSDRPKPVPRPAKTVPSLDLDALERSLP